ncbi:unnamed protein product [Mytilus edulis]|uniref:DDE Tnp4 domain-containing protein n=1 Tax=Mytilus edulis TaxID=6550 RepID=A0A8S3UNL8_MYTED|nr:unnamed protein product [Mytilus edulis]
MVEFVLRERMDKIRKGRKDSKCILCEKEQNPEKEDLCVEKQIKICAIFSVRISLFHPMMMDVICDTCRRKYYREGQAQVNTPTVLTNDTNANDPDFMPPSAPKRAKLSSPLSISLPISSTIKGHAQCCLCKKRGPKLMQNNDAKILNSIFKNNLEKIKEWFDKDDVVVVDRGFRDSIDLLEEFGIQTKMPSFLKRNEKQLSVEDGNTTRLDYKGPLGC